MYIFVGEGCCFNYTSSFDFPNEEGWATGLFFEGSRLTRQAIWVGIRKRFYQGLYDGGVAWRLCS
jgi:hypothetical protein